MTNIAFREKLEQTWSSLLQIHKKVNLVTLVIRDKELSQEYKEVRLHHYWTFIVIADIVREIVMVLAILGGYFENRDLSPSYAARLIYYILIVLLYKVSER